MIQGMHGMYYSDDAEATRAFFRDKLGFDATDVGDGWLIFDMPEADLGVHPTGDGDEMPEAGAASVSFYCDDIEETVAELEERGVEFTDEIHDEGFGYVTYFAVPGGLTVQLYEPKYEK